MNTSDRRTDEGTGNPKERRLSAGSGPAVRQQLIELLNRALSDASKHVLEPGERIYLGQFARRHEAAQHRHRFASSIASHECPVVAPHRDAAQAPLGMVVVDR